MNGSPQIYATTLYEYDTAGLLIHRDTLREGRGGQIRGHFDERGVAPERIRLSTTPDGGGSHWNVYRSIDVALGSPVPRFRTVTVTPRGATSLT